MQFYPVCYIILFPFWRFSRPVMRLRRIRAHKLVNYIYLYGWLVWRWRAAATRGALPAEARFSMRCKNSLRKCGAQRPPRDPLGTSTGIYHMKITSGTASRAANTLRLALRLDRLSRKSRPSTSLPHYGRSSHLIVLHLFMCTLLQQQRAFTSCRGANIVRTAYSRKLQKHSLSEWDKLLSQTVTSTVSTLRVDIAPSWQGFSSIISAF